MAGRNILYENPVKIIKSINPDKAPTPKACMLILKYMFASNATDEERNIPRINPVRMGGTLGWFLKTRYIQK